MDMRIDQGLTAPISWKVRRLRRADAPTYHTLRLEGFIRHPLQFRVAPEDESNLSIEAVADRLERTFVAGGFEGEELVGVGGLTRFDGAKLRHRALLWGMYVSDRGRGRGLADELMLVLLSEARAQMIEQVVLTVVADNDRARRFYQRWGFSVYGTEPRAIKVGDSYLDEALMVCRLD
jgi:ribosomal protein S18 acetylase RimI-like enzyme